MKNSLQSPAKDFGHYQHQTQRLGEGLRHGPPQTPKPGQEILGPLQNQRLQLAPSQSRPPGRHPNEGERQLQHMQVLRQS